MKKIISFGLFVILFMTSNHLFAQAQLNNVILFVADGLRPGMINQENAPAMTALMNQGVRFINSHSIFPTFTMANAASMSTGHLLGDNGIFSNTLYTKFPIKSANNSQTPFIENNAVLGEMDSNFGEDYLNEETILSAARKKGLLTAAIGKVGPTLMFDHLARSGNDSIIIDDSTGKGGIPLPAFLEEQMLILNLPKTSPTRGQNGNAGNSVTSGTQVANIAQQQYFTDIATQAILPHFKKENRPFILIFWSRDPDGSQHNQGDSLNEFTPGINGPTSLAAIRNADHNLAALQKALKELRLDTRTNIILASDHGFSTISKQSETSHAAQMNYKGVIPGYLPPGFLAIDLAHHLSLQLFDPDNNNAIVPANELSKKGNGLIGSTSSKPELVIAANGGSDLLYLPTSNGELTKQIINTLSSQDYVSGIFVNDRLGKFPGTLPMSSIGMIGNGLTPTPDMVVNFKSFSLKCKDPTTCGIEIADTPLQQGQGMHGNFSKADTFNTMAAIGPNFKKKYLARLPASNADLGVTIAKLLNLPIQSKGALKGRYLSEAIPHGRIAVATRAELRSEPDLNGHVTVLKYQKVDHQIYFDVAGYPGRTLGLSTK